MNEGTLLEQKPPERAITERNFPRPHQAMRRNLMDVAQKSACHRADLFAMQYTQLVRELRKFGNGSNYGRT